MEQLQAYSIEDEQYVIENADKLTAKIIGQHIGRSKSSVVQKLGKLGIKKLPRKKHSWSEEQLAVLINNTGVLAHKEIGKMIGKSADAVSAYANKLGIDSSARKGQQENTWTKDEIKYLKENYRENDIEKMMRYLNRCEKGIRIKATRLGLKTEKIWTDKEVCYLKQNNNIMSCYQIGKTIGRTTQSIRRKRIKLGLAKKRDKITEPEALIMEQLDKNKIAYTFQYKVGKYITDYHITGTSTIVEVLGDYWHVNPEVYKVPKGFQKYKIEKDKIRQKYIEDRGYKVINLWENDIVKDPTQIINTLKTEIYGNN